MKTRELSDSIRIPMGVLTAFLAGVMFLTVTLTSLKFGEWIVSLINN